jgi:hypothetical protein
MCPQFIHDLQEVMGTDGLHQLLQACGWLGVPLPENREDFMGQWIGLRENLNRKPWFLPSNIGLSCKFSHHPVL